MAGKDGAETRHGSATQLRVACGRKRTKVVSPATPGDARIEIRKQAALAEVHNGFAAGAGMVGCGLMVLFALDSIQSLAAHPSGKRPQLPVKDARPSCRIVYGIGDRRFAKAELAPCAQTHFM